MLGKVLTLVTYGVFLIILIAAGALYRDYHDIQTSIGVQQDITRVCVLDLLETRQRILHNQCLIMRAIIPLDFTNSSSCQGLEKIDDVLLGTLSIIPQKHGK